MNKIVIVQGYWDTLPFDILEKYCHDIACHSLIKNFKRNRNCSRECILQNQ